VFGIRDVDYPSFDYWILVGLGRKWKGMTQLVRIDWGSSSSGGGFSSVNGRSFGGMISFGSPSR